MKKNVWVTMGFSVSLIAIVVAGCESFLPMDTDDPNVDYDTPQEIVWGDALLLSQLDGTEVKISEVGSSETAWTGTTENGRFGERFTLPEGKDYIASITVDSLYDPDVQNTLRAYIPDYTSGQFIHINIVSTILARYIEVTGLTCDEAEAQLKTRLGITSTEPLASLPYHIRNSRQFSSRRFAQVAQEMGGLDNYVDWLAEKLAESNETLSFDALGGVESNTAETAALMSRTLNSPELKEGWFGEAMSKLGLGVFGGIGKAIGNAVGEVAIGWVMSAIGVEQTDDTQEKLDQILNELDGVQDSLDTIESDITALEGELQMSADEIILATMNQEMRGIENSIDTEWSKLLALVESEPTDAQLELMGNELLYGTYDAYTGISSLVNQYDAILMGSDGYLKTYADMLVLQTLDNDRDNLLQAYQLFEAKFLRVLTYEIKVICLNVEALHYYESKGIATSQSAENYLDSIMDNYIRPQVEHYLECVDEIVVRYTDTRLLVPRLDNALPLNVETVYAKADYLATQIDPQTYPGGVVVRMIGPPDVVQFWLNSQLHVMNTETELEPIYYGGLVSSDESYRALTHSVGANVDHATNGYYCGIYRATHNGNGTAERYGKMFSTVAIARMYAPIDQAGTQYVVVPANGDALMFDSSWYSDQTAIEVVVGEAYLDASFMPDDATPFGEETEGLDESPVLFGLSVLNGFEMYAPDTPSEMTSDYSIMSDWRAPQFDYDLHTMSMAITMNGHGGTHQYHSGSAEMKLLGDTIILDEQDIPSVVSADYNGYFHVHKNNSDPELRFWLGDLELASMVPPAKKWEGTFDSEGLQVLDLGNTLDLSVQLDFHSHHSAIQVDYDKLKNDLTGQVELLQIFGQH